MEPLLCPLCGYSEIERVLEDVAISADVKGELRPVKAMSAYRCRQKGHFFLVRERDTLEEENSGGPKASYYRPGKWV